MYMATAQLSQGRAAAIVSRIATQKLVKEYGGKYTPKDQKDALIKKILDLSDVPF